MIFLLHSWGPLFGVPSKVPFMNDCSELWRGLHFSYVTWKPNLEELEGSAGSPSITESGCFKF